MSTLGYTSLKVYRLSCEIFSSLHCVCVCVCAHVLCVEVFYTLYLFVLNQLVIQGAISTDDRSQIAIDQILLSDGLCSGTGEYNCLSDCH